MLQTVSTGEKYICAVWYMNKIHTVFWFTDVISINAMNPKLMTVLALSLMFCCHGVGLVRSRNQYERGEALEVFVATTPGIFILLIMTASTTIDSKLDLV